MTLFKHWRIDVADIRRELYPAGCPTWVDELALTLTGVIALTLMAAIRLVGGAEALRETLHSRDPVARPVTE